MKLKTYRAKSLHQALQWIRAELGPEAAVLHTREVAAGPWGWLGGRQLEVTAGVGIDVPSRFEAEADPEGAGQTVHHATNGRSHVIEYRVPAADEQDFRSQFRRDLQQSLERSSSVVEELSQRSMSETWRVEAGAEGSHGDALTRLLAELLAAEFDNDLAHELVENVRLRSSQRDAEDFSLLKSRLAQLIEERISCSGPIILPRGRQRIVALVGPTGVGKTTTIAKLAASFHLRENRRVGLVTVDTYRIAAVDQLRTYADIIDLPMEVVSTPREMRRALAKLADMELILIDTAGRGPSDDLKIQELKSVLQEARADEVQLVVSSVCSLSSLKNTVARFTAAGITGMVLTKLDEATGLGQLLTLLDTCRLPLSYITHGQSVPDDITPADPRRLARDILKMDGGT